MNHIDALNKSITLTKELTKAHIKEHQRHSQSGAVSTVKEHDDSRTPLGRHADNESKKANKGSNDWQKHYDMHHRAAKMHEEAMHDAAMNGDKKNADHHLEQAKLHISHSTDKMSGDGSKSSYLRRIAADFHHTTDQDRKKRYGSSKDTDNGESYKHELSRHAHQEAADHNEKWKDKLSVADPYWQTAASGAKDQQNKADINDAHVTHDAKKSQPATLDGAIASSTALLKAHVKQYARKDGTVHLAAANHLQEKGEKRK